MFLAGNHTVNTTVNLTSISEITLRGERNSQVNFLCSIEVVFLFENVSDLKIEGLVFLSRNIAIESVALKIVDSNGVWIHNVGFLGSYSFSKPFTGLDITSSDTITVTSCSFEGNTADNGGAIYVTAESNLTLNASTFIGNNATRDGGAIYASGSNLTLSDNMFSGNTAGNGGAMYVTAESNVTISDNAFTHNRAIFGGAMYSEDSIVSIYGSTKNSSILSSEGYCRTCDMITTIPKSIPYEEVIMELNEAFCATHFTNNTAEYYGGTMFIKNSAMLFSGSVIMFRYSAAGRGGAMDIRSGSSVTSNTCNLFFNSNKAYVGGGFQMIGSNFHTEVGNMYFLHNSAQMNGGGIYYPKSIYADDSLLLLSGNSYFIANTAGSVGGAVYSSGSFTITASAIFIENTATLGGAFNSERGNFSVSGDIKFVNNTAWSCGGMILGYGGNIRLNDVSAIGNSNSALCIHQSNVVFSGMINISNNTGTEGGGIKVTRKNSQLYFTGSTVLYGNKAGLGGAIYSLFGTKLTFSGDTLFSHNTADTNGGAIYSEYTNITFDENSALSFKCNTAENGGAMYLSSASFLTFNRGVNIRMSYNHATKYGGGIYNEDIASATQCSFKVSDITKLSLPYCFIRVTYFDQYYPTLIYSKNNSANISGETLHGGLLDRCQTNIFESLGFLFHSQVACRAITSEPYQLCFCTNVRQFHCNEMKSIEIYPGQKFHVSLIALDQTDTSVTTEITAISAASRLNSDQSSQTLEPECSKLWYNLYSTQDTDQLILYPDGPCRDTGVARAVVNVMFKPCPDGFQKSGENCVCEEILNEYNANCTINDNPTISRKVGSEFWVQGWYENETYQGLIHYKTCPRDYCKRGEVTISLENPDTQCDLNRSGLLCGECATNHSLMLGSSRCHVCPNTYFALLLPFAAAGIALVVFLSILRLTVATGMINSVILYANFVQINRSIFLPTDSTRNILTVFIAWTNLDLGFETCFYDGMTAYAQTWLQFAFPLYVWMLMGLIIVTCRYSVTLSKLIGHNPIAVLATLLLMSYNKVLKIMIDVYSFAPLDYPQLNTRLVWLKDANVLFWGSKHLLLTVVTSLVLVFIFLPYTLLLLLGYKLYGFSDRKGLRWLNRLKPLLDSYYAPYNTHTRYWTGFLLLVRCVLYSVFSLGDTHKSLVSIIITFTALVGVVWISSKVYTSRIANTVEVSVYLNLIILSALSTNSVVSAQLFYTLVALVFVTMLGIIIYHFHLLYIAQSAMWTKMKDWIKHIISKPHTNPPPDTEVTSTPVHNINVPSTSDIELREPLLDN